jgi:hypothetical protein
MGDALRGAVRAAALRGGTPLAPEVIAEARERATRILSDTSPADADGFRDLRNMTLAIGLPATRALFHQMIAACGAKGRRKAAAMREVAEFSPVTEVGCMKVDFHDRTCGRGRVAYLVLEPCPRDHDFGAQLDKLKARTSEEKWPEILRHLSMLVHIGQTVYAETAGSHADLVRRLTGGGGERYLKLKVDGLNTTLYLDEGWPERIGIFVRLEGEV